MLQRKQSMEQMDIFYEQMQLANSTPSKLKSEL
jgi:hypothetical protein